MAEALEQVKRRFGNDAVILHTRTFRAGGILGLGGRSMVEVTASRPTNTAAPSSRIFSLQEEARRAKVCERPGQWSRSADGSASPMPSTPTISLDQTAPRLLEELSSLKALVQSLLARARRSDASLLPGPVAEAYVELIQHCVAEDVAGQLVEHVRTELGNRKSITRAAISECLARHVEAMLPVAGPICLAPGASPTVIALVGPTGVGKTTTVAKLAANFSLREGRKVGLVTIDTYRIAAVEQLRTFAQIIDVPLEVAATPAELKQAIRRLRDRELILIDTTGRSPSDRAKLDELKQFLDEASPHEIHLVLASTCSQGVLLDTVERYRCLKVNRIIFTKLDEAVGFGAILTCLVRAQAKLSYVTTGQDVPDDIEVGRGRALAHLIVKGTRLAER